MNEDLTNLTDSINEMAAKPKSKEVFEEITETIGKFIEAAAKIDNPSTDETAKPK